MARFERLLIPIVLVVMLAAFLLEGLGPAGARSVAIGVGATLALVLVAGMVQRMRKKGRAPTPQGSDPQTSNDGPEQAPPPS